jgi:hypothetical protein
MDHQAQRIAWLRLALAEILSSPDPTAARTAEAALTTDDEEMRQPGSARHVTLQPQSPGRIEPPKRFPL